MPFQTKRIYALPAESDGYRVLVDRLWPRGLSKAVAAIDLWLRDVAPSNELRTWYGHDVARWPEFRRRYRGELADRGDLLNRLLELERAHGTVTLLFAARDETRNEAEVLADVLRRRARPESGQGSRPGS